MKSIQLEQMSEIEGGGFIGAFCGGTGLLAAGVRYGVIAVANPPAALGAFAVVLTGCAAYGLYSAFTD